MASFGFILLISATGILIPLITSQQPYYVTHLCPISDNFPSNDAFLANLKVMLSFLNTNSTHSGGFYTASAGRIPNRASGLFLCRGDLSPESCQRCVEAASQDIINRCQNQKEGVIWYDECMLRYSYSSTISEPVESPRISFPSGIGIGDIYGFNTKLDSLMNDLVEEAVSNDKRFATKDVSLSSSERIYGLVQCTPDINSEYCKSCLKECISNIPLCCDGKEGGIVLKLSCNIRYGSAPFYTITTLATPPLPSQPNSEGKTQNLQFYTFSSFVYEMLLNKVRRLKVFKFCFLQFNFINHLTTLAQYLMFDVFLL